MKEVYYHGTHLYRAKRILREGFRVGELDLYGDGTPYYAGPGNIGTGTYLSSDWRVALWFGRAIVKAHLRPGTRILRMGEPPDRKIIGYLRKEFGKELFETTCIKKVLPQNKKLTLSEYIALLNYHYEKTGRYFWRGEKIFSEKVAERRWLHAAAMHRLGAGLKRFGIHGFGKPETHNGVVVFQPDRIVVDEVEVVVSQATRNKLVILDRCAKLKSLEELKEIDAGRVAPPT